MLCILSRNVSLTSITAEVMVRSRRSARCSEEMWLEANLQKSTEKYFVISL